eukprot:Em0214g1a
MVAAVHGSNSTRTFSSVDFTEADAWPRWKKRFEQFRVASGLCNEDESRQVSTLLYCLGEGAEEVLQATATSLEKAKNSIEELIRDRIVIGIRDKALSRRLQLDADLTLEKAMRLVRQNEAVGEQQKVLQGIWNTKKERIVVAPNRNGDIRICVDLKALNESVLGEVYPLPTVDETLAQLTGATVFSKLDANSGFWQIPLADSSRLLTTFITPFGRYCFNKLPFGISSAPELFQKRMGQILEGLDGVLCQMDGVE